MGTPKPAVATDHCPSILPLQTFPLTCSIISLLECPSLRHPTPREIYKSLGANLPLSALGIMLGDFNLRAPILFQDFGAEGRIGFWSMTGLFLP